MGELIGFDVLQRLRATKLLHKALVLKKHNELGTSNADWLDQHLLLLRSKGEPITMGEIREMAKRFRWEKGGDG